MLLVEEQVKYDVVTVFAVFHFLVVEVPVTVEQLVMARDALLRLLHIAQSSGFFDVVSFFNDAYGTICRELAMYLIYV
jgi:hypothetical protein